MTEISINDRERLVRLEELFRSRDQKLTRTELPLILPIGMPAAYALDSEGYVVGLKFGSPPEAQKVLEIAVGFPRLRRFVLGVRPRAEKGVPDEQPGRLERSRSVDIPTDLANLSDLRFLWLSGGIRKIPEEMFRRDLPIVSSRPDGTGPSELARSLDLAVEVLRKSQLHLAKEKGGTPQHELEDWGLIPAEDQKELLRLGSNLVGIFLSDVQVEDPPIEIAIKGQAAVRSYFQEREAGSLQLNELKVLLVGHGSCGKTSLVKRLLGEQFDPRESQTHGINIKTLKLGSKKTRRIKANFWDFGGQEIMHATHQFFLSKRSLYVLVLDGRKEEDPEYWLQHIRSFGGDSPVMVVLNKIDDNPSFDVNRRFLKEKYQQITSYFRVSCATGAGIADFRKNLEELLSSASVLQTSWPRSWFNVKRQLEGLASDYISIDQYNKICEIEGVTDQKSKDALVDFLHDLGVILHFRDLQLEDTHVLDPRWVTEGVYRIINSDLLAEQKGVLRLNQLGDIFRLAEGKKFRYTPDKYDYIVQLMLKFELCYKVGDSAMLVPDLLDIQEPEIGFGQESSLRFVLEYKYLPRSVMPRFIVRMHQDIRGSKSWRTGVELEDKSLKARAVVRADEKAKRIYISVSGGQKRDYFSVVRKVLSDINASFEKLEVTEKVPLPDAPEEEIEYRELIGHELAQRDEIFVGRVGRGYRVQTLLSGIEERAARGALLSQSIINVDGPYFAQPVAQATLFENRNTEGDKRVSYQPQNWERMLTYGTAFLFVALVAFLLVRNQPIADPNLVVLVRILLSLIVSVFGASVPGMLRVDLTTRKGLIIRATGALALFVLTFVMTPTVLTAHAH